MTRYSAGILLHRGTGDHLEVLLGHMGGPYYARKDERAWSAPKGLLEPGEDVLAAARREFTEELGLPVPAGDLTSLGTARTSDKTVELFALAGDLDVAAVVPGTFTLEWPRGSGQQQEFPEIDRAAWFDLATAAGKVVAYQTVFLDRLRALVP